MHKTVVDQSTHLPSIVKDKLSLDWIDGQYIKYTQIRGWSGSPVVYWVWTGLVLS